MNTDTKPDYTFKRSLTTCLAPALAIPAVAVCLQYLSDNITAATALFYRIIESTLSAPATLGGINLCLATAAVYLFCCAGKYRTINTITFKIACACVAIPYTTLSVLLCTLLANPDGDIPGNMLIWTSLFPATGATIYMIVWLLANLMMDEF